MKLRKMRGNIMLLIAAVIWGSAFVAQSEGMNYIGPFTYVFSRSIIGAAVLVIIIYAIRAVKKKNNEYHPADLKMSAWGGVCCGAVLFAAASFQQFGISNTTAGKAGFITTLYVIIVPVLGFFMKKKTPSRVWICAAVAVAGFYLLCIRNDFSRGSGDLLVLISAVFFSLHIIVIDYFNKRNTDPMIMSCFQFLTAGIIGFPVMIILEEPDIRDIMNAALPILYAGVLSSGIAFTLQIIAQKDTDPTVATMIMSLESVFAVLSGWLILGETLSIRELSGCILVFAAVIAAQLPAKSEMRKQYS